MAENLLQKIWKNPIQRYIFIFLASACGDFLIALHSYSIAHRWIWTQGLVGFVLPFVSFIFSIWFIETKDIIERLKLTFVAACGMIFGSTAMLLCIK